MSRRYLTAAVLGQLDTQLTEHDRAVLRTVSDLRFVSGGQLTRLHFASDQASARAARRALLRLTRLGVLERLPRTVGGVRRGSSGFIYRLGPAGQSLAVQAGNRPGGISRTFRGRCFCATLSRLPSCIRCWLKPTAVTRWSC